MTREKQKSSIQYADGISWESTKGKYEMKKQRSQEMALHFGKMRNRAYAFGVLYLFDAFIYMSTMF